jgi:hypothetical protein
MMTFLVFAATGCAAGETRVVVRARAHDGKFIGTSVGGMQVIVRDAASRNVLATGHIEGGTGDTKRLMKEPVSRRKQLADDKTAKFTAGLDIDRPTRICVEVCAPNGSGNNEVLASQTLWVLPGKHIEGDGLVFNLHGFLVHAVSPAPNERWKPGEAVPIRAWVSMLCGCHIWPDGLWDANEYTITAVIENAEGKELARIPLDYAGKKSHFEGTFKPPGPGSYKLILTASAPKSGNYGVCITGFSVK